MTLYSCINYTYLLILLQINGAINILSSIIHAVCYEMCSMYSLLCRI